MMQEMPIGNVWSWTLDVVVQYSRVFQWFLEEDQGGIEINPVQQQEGSQSQSSGPEDERG
jgi:hypothetical protein